MRTVGAKEAKTHFSELLTEVAASATVEITKYSDAIAEILKRDHAVVPIIWPLEIGNAILTAVRRGESRKRTLPC
jgi:antitoxin (DNA-binding transcriptional repressor) of toxin-antitoxin stability system